MNFAVVIVNWNGAADTVACLASVLRPSSAARVIVIDNGSTDDSLARIESALRDLGITILHAAGAAPETALPQLATAKLRDAGAVLVEAGENLGFAAGANLGLAVAQRAGLAFTVFLNNDTIVQADALDRIVQRLAGDPGLFACLPMLTIHGTDRIWNCGGDIYRVGLRRYHHAGQRIGDVQLPPELRCTFFTGCCFAVRTAEFAQRNGFTERFFFGEEDFELALWMRDRKLTALCLTSAVVAHKVSASFSAAAGPREDAKVFLYYLNRFIHMRLRLGLLGWRLWLAMVLPYTAALLWRRPGWSLGAVMRFLRRLLRHARRMNGVTRQDFEAVMAGML
jgi:GT2 family glycosyltransferase